MHSGANRRRLHQTYTGPARNSWNVFVQGVRTRPDGSKRSDQEKVNRVTGAERWGWLCVRPKNGKIGEDNNRPELGQLLKYRVSYAQNPPDRMPICVRYLETRQRCQ